MGREARAHGEGPGRCTRWYSRKIGQEHEELKAEAEHRAKEACGVKRQAFRASVAARPPKMGKFVVDNMGRRVD